jgi:hypothetical protein
MLILVENRRGPGGLTGPVSIGLTDPLPEVRIGPWRMRAGLGGEHERWFRPPDTLDELTSWGDVTSPTRRSPIRWYRTRFEFPKAADRPWASGQAIGGAAHRAQSLFLQLGSLRSGVVWLNGHCLGHYRQIGYDAERGVYLPSCWLRGENWVFVAETGGGVPRETSLRRAPGRLQLITVRMAGPF